MKKRMLGNRLEVSALGLGCMPMTRLFSAETGTYGKVDAVEAQATLHQAIDLGVTLFDTAEVYGPYANEEFLGKAIKGQRDGLVIATKYGFQIKEGRIVGIDCSPANARRVCEASLRRLGIDIIDLFFQHRIDPAIPIEEAVGGIADLVIEGKVRHIGLCEASPDTLRRAHATHPITALQSEYSLWEREVEREILPLTQALGIGFIPWSPLGRGFLTGSFSTYEDLPQADHRQNDPRFEAANFKANLKILDGIKAVAARHGVSPARVALAWLLSKDPSIVPIPGSKRRVTMEDSMAAADLELSQGDLDMLDAVAPIGVTSGDRYRAEQRAILATR